MSLTTSPGPPSPPSPPRVSAQRQRLADVVQAVGKRPADIERRRWESLTVFATFAVLYTVVGYWLVVDKHVVGFEALDRTLRAYSIFYNEPPRLAVVGFDYPPLSVLLLAPFTLVPALTTSLAVVPVASAVLAATTLVVVNTMMRRALVTLPMRLTVLVALGLNPMVVLHASTGARSFLWLAFVVAALGALFAWYVTADIRFVMLAGVAFAVAALTGYGSLVWFLVGLVMIAAILARLGADGTEVEGTTVGFAAPTAYVVGLWTLLNLVLLGDPFHWVTDNRDATASAPDLSFLDVVRGTGELVLDGAPIAVVVLPALLVAGVTRRNTFALWLGVVLLVSILLPGLTALAGVSGSPMQLQHALPVLLVSVVGAVWLARSAVDGSTLVAGALAAGLALSIPWTLRSMETYPHQGLERAFHDAVTTGQSQEGALTVDGAVVGYDDERDMADEILALDLADGSVLTDEAATYAVVLMTGDPGVFYDRGDRSDGSWDDAAVDPADHVDYLLLSRTSAADRLSRLYPDAVDGTDQVLTTRVRNDRYVLVAVPDGYRYGDDEAGSSGPVPGPAGGVDGGVLGEERAPATTGERP